MFPRRPAAIRSISAFVTLKPGADPDQAAAALRAALPDGHAGLHASRTEIAHEVAYWTTRTATGLIFGSGLVVSVIVGIMVLYQTLATQISRQLPQFATLKAIGYTNRFLDGIVLIEAVLIMVVAFARPRRRRSASTRWSGARPCCPSPSM